MNLYDEKLRNDLLAEKHPIAVLGVGYIGLSTCIAYAREGVRVIGYDIDAEKIQKYRQGICDLPFLEDWLNAKLVDQLGRRLSFTTDFEEIRKSKPPVIFVAVNTERNGKPWLDALNNVMEKVSTCTGHPLIVVESTTVPRTLRKYVCPHYDLVCAPRRDWFIDRSKNLRTLPRVFACDRQTTTSRALAVLGIVTNTLHRASTLETAELIKTAENALQHTQMMFASELALGYPDLDVNEVMRLAGEHWRLGGKWWRAGLRSGGYCIGPAGAYIIEGAQYPQHLQVISSALTANEKISEVVAERFLHPNISIGIVGFSYKEDLKVPVLSAGLKLAQVFLSKGHKVTVYDPLYSPEEIKQLVDNASVNVAEQFKDLEGTHLVFVLSPHSQIRALPIDKIRSVLGNATIIDETGCWERYRELFRESGIDYHRVGDKGWLK